jgi:hypothetical protein
MGSIHDPVPVKLFVGMLASDPARLVEVEGPLVADYGPIDLASDVWPFTHTDYYRDEMGAGLLRKFVSFERLIRPDDIIDVKRRTNAIEDDVARSAGGNPPRPVNLDPGYLSLSKVVLATTKDYTHRLYLGRGIYAEVTLRFHKGKYEPWDWTYPDYREPAYCAFFLAMRTRLTEQLRSLRP